MKKYRTDSYFSLPACTAFYILNDILNGKVKTKKKVCYSIGVLSEHADFC